MDSPTVKELDDVMATQNSALDYAAFKAVYMRPREPEPSFEQLVEVFRVSDPHRTGTINKNELQRMLMHIGDKFSLEEFNMLMKKADEQDGEVDYESLIRKMQR